MSADYSPERLEEATQIEILVRKTQAAWRAVGRPKEGGAYEAFDAALIFWDALPKDLAALANEEADRREASAAVQT